MHNALVLRDDPENYAARAEIMWAGSLSHNGLTGCGNDAGDWACHRLEHELGALYDVTHGAGLTAVWPAWARYVMKNCLHRFVRFAVNVMGAAPGATDEETAEKGIDALAAFFRSIGMPTNLKELGVSPADDDFKLLAKNCAIAVGGRIGSAMPLYEKDMEAIYRAAKE